MNQREEHGIKHVRNIAGCEGWLMISVKKISLIARENSASLFAPWAGCLSESFVKYCGLWLKQFYSQYFDTSSGNVSMYVVGWDHK